MIEARIKQAAETIHSANKLTITEGILHTIAVEARKEGWKEGAKKMRERVHSKLLSLSFSSGYLDPSHDCVDMDMGLLLRDAQKEIEAERLKEGKP